VASVADDLGLSAQTTYSWRRQDAIDRGEMAGLSRFPTRHHYAAYNGTAPIEMSSGGRKRHRLNPRGNRMLNHAILLIAICQLRQPNTTGWVFYERNLEEGKTKKEAIRS